LAFSDFVQVELPLRPFVAVDGVAGQTLVRSTNPLAPRELVWVDTSGGGSGQSAFDIAVLLGFQGTQAEWLASLVGAKGDTGAQGETGLQGIKGDQGIQGETGLQGIQGEPGLKGDAGLTGKSAFEIAQLNGFTGTESEWLSSLKGDKGDLGGVGLKGETGLTGETGASAYNIACLLGFSGTQSEWLASLKGETGTVDTTLLTNEVTRAITAETLIQTKLDTEVLNRTNALALELLNRTNADNDLATLISNIPKGDTGLSAYAIAVALGFQGTESAWITSLKGDKGVDGIDGKSAYTLAVLNGYVGDESSWILSLKGTNGVDSNSSQLPTVAISANSLSNIDTLDLSLYSESVWDILLETYAKVRRFTIASLYNKITNKLNYTTYGILGDFLTYTVTIGFDNNTLKLNIHNKEAEAMAVTALRYPIKKV